MKQTKTPPVDRTKVPENPVKQGEIVTKADAAGRWMDTLRKMEPQIRSSIAGMKMHPEQIFQHAMNAMKFAPKLMECTSYSVCGCLMKASTLGLSLDPTLGEAYMVPFKNKNTQKMEAQFIVGYKGLQKRVRRSGTVKSIRTILVYEGDYFEYANNPWPEFTHIPWQIAFREGQTKADTQGPVRCAVSVVESTDSDHPLIEIMWKPELDKIRARSQSRDNGPWVTDTDEMYRKTVFRRHSKWIASDPETQQAIALDEMAELAIPQNMAHIALGDDSTFEADVETGKTEIAAQEGSQTPPQPELPTEDALRAQVYDRISQRALEMCGGDALNNPKFDEAIIGVAHKLKLPDQDVSKWGLDALNVLWEEIRPDAKA